ncbi:sigma-70 family RNA polymerase sigma factor [Rivularia sp. UHCC 0363]|uniref:RNA polymerase sigma factor n=1 Tax=Rivularia sp. UHCC 0363 TaxID=3110244 RepID=UPI002B1FF609|nr:sigma-70 family RNA polymerase sigma factor [Rivularia sp. UHCC 0363]MEA5595738.1 sigma-70 family RNA polymerase sigma factor [Rivularia sp. UHCC 0363]
MVANYSRQTFDAEFQTLLFPGSSSAHSTLAFVLRSLTQFNLSQSFSVTEILIDAYLRGVKQIERGEYIENPLPWIRSTSYNIIREHSRERKKLYQLEEDKVEFAMDCSLVGIEEINENLEKVLLAFKKLDEEEKEILTLKIVEKLTWKEILELLEQRGIKFKNETALRKRKERALKRLRKIYHSLYSTIA